MNKTTTVLIIILAICLAILLCYTITPTQTIRQEYEKTITLPVSFEKLRLRLGDKDFLSEAVSMANGEIVYRAEVEKDFKILRVVPLTWSLEIHEHFIIETDGKEIPLYSDTSVRPDYIHTTVSLADPSVFYGVENFENKISIYPAAKDHTFVRIQSVVLIQEKIPPKLKSYVEDLAKPQVERVCEQTCKAIIYAAEKDATFFENYLKKLKEKSSE